MFAHIFKSGKKFQLLITNTCALSDGIVSEAFFDNKKDAKDAAKAINAKAWNY